MPDKPRKPRTRIAQDDIDLFRRAMSGATRYEETAPRAAAKKSSAKKPAAKKSAAPKPKPSAKTPRRKPPAPAAKPARRGVLRDQTEQGDYVEFARGGLQTRVMRKLKRGEYRIGAELDLHGLTTAEAEKALSDFLRAAAAKGAKAALVIHGKGLRSGGKGGVMKRFVLGWLKKRGEVKAFCSAVGKDGGTGAVYVLLGRG
ncbi:MAG: Smr/MutS family protein [Gammaproteobacteria bacterium]|nr:Smr/MutS family protein [Gammaproteobacteria bacterium]